MADLLADMNLGNATNELPTYDALAGENNVLRSHCAVLTQKLYQLQEELKNLRKQVDESNAVSDSKPRKHARTSSNLINNINNDNNSNNNNDNNNLNNISNVGANGMNDENMCVGNAASVDNRSNSAANFTLVEKKKKKIFQAINVDIKSLNQQFKNSNFQNYTIKQNSINAPVKIAITNESDVPKFRDELIKTQVSFHEFKWDSEKSKAFIMRGLVNANEDDLPYIKSELVAAGLPNNIILSLFKSGYMRANPGKKHNSLVQIILPPNSDAKTLFDIKFLDHMAVKIEPLRNSKTLQCKNCQRFDHSAGGCQHEHRCVKCGNNHYKNDCPRTLNKTFKLRCCNCGGEHTANNVNSCKYALNFINNSNKTITSNNNNNNTKRRPMSDNIKMPMVHPTRGASGSNSANNNINKSYAQVLAGDNTLNNLTKKIDFLIETVIKHEQLFNKILNNE